MISTRSIVRPALAGAMLFLGFGRAAAQLPTSVDIDLAVDPAVDSLTVKVRANGATFQELMTALSFTVRWPAASGASLGARTVPCSGAIPLAPTATQTVGAFNYKTYNAFGLSLIQDECPGQAWTAGQWITVMRVQVTGNTGCTEFNIVNDAWTGANNRDLFVSLNGLERTGTIEPNPDAAGNCATDCLGQVGGTALPGTACNDGSSCTTNDTWSAACTCGGTLVDTDGDGVCDQEDGCPGDPLKTVPGLCGCGVSDADTDGDGLADCLDACPADPLKTVPGVCGCGVPDADTDADGTADCLDGCPGDAQKTVPGTCGCGAPEPGASCDDGDPQTVNDQVGLDCSCAGSPVDCDDGQPCTLDSFDGATCQNTPLPDTDADGICDLVDLCPADPLKTVPGACGCGVADTDTDADGIADCVDDCPTVAGVVGSACDDGDVATIDDVLGSDCSCNGTVVDCDDGDPCTADAFDGTTCQHVPLPDGDGDGTCDPEDGCPADPLKTTPGTCGCGVPDADNDGDGAADCIDQCPNDPLKTAPGQCGCGVADTDTDADGTADCVDGCPDDPLKIAPGVCGCGAADGDADTDGVADCIDGCPADPQKTTPGQCGCGIPDTDGDADGTADCNDACPTDPLKTAPGQCGCNVVDTDTDADGAADCVDACPADPLKIAPGACGCGVADTDTDADGIADCNDTCPETPGVPGNECDDGDPATTGDVVGADCICQGAALNDDCASPFVLDVQPLGTCPDNATSGSNGNATASGANPTCAPVGALADVWYTFNAGANTSVTITLTPLSMGDWGFSVQTACTAVELECIAQPSGPVEVPVEPGVDHLVRVFGSADPGATGTFELCVADGLGTAITELSVTDLLLAPNPSDGPLQWQWPAVSGPVQWELVSATGALVASGMATGVNGWYAPTLAAPPPGVYLVRMRCDALQAERRWVVR
jgi:hypothetical protein